MVEEIQLRRPARLNQIDDALGLGSKMRQSRQSRVRGLAGGRCGCLRVRPEQARQSSRSDSGARQAEEIAPRELKLILEPGSMGAILNPLCAAVLYVLQILKSA